MSVDGSFAGNLEKAKPGNGTNLLPYIQYKNHLKAMTEVKGTTDTGLGSPEKHVLHQTKKLRHELTSILSKNRK